MITLKSLIFVVRSRPSRGSRGQRRARTDFSDMLSSRGPSSATMLVVMPSPDHRISVQMRASHASFLIVAHSTPRSIIEYRPILRLFNALTPFPSARRRFSNQVGLLARADPHRGTPSHTHDRCLISTVTPRNVFEGKKSGRLFLARTPSPFLLRDPCSMRS